MAKHKETDECRESFPCAICQRKFPASERLEVHMMVAHPANDDLEQEPDEPQQENLANDEPDVAFRIRWLNGYSIGILIVNEEAKFAHNKTTAKGALSLPKEGDNKVQSKVYHCSA